ncbi:MAG: hypothetical protein KDJ19_12400 [Hyphomicrobiaceae bacterium]|nr:hypothetical protein [Hyphomicrobiaceae bacterium]
MIVDLLIVLIAPALTLALVPLLQARAVDLGLIQVANARSSHDGARASGAGIVLALGATLSGLLLALVHNDPGLIAPVATIAALALVGFADDLFNLPVTQRLAAQLLAALLLVLLAGGWDWFVTLPIWIAAPVLIAMALAGGLWINLFNFMDGIDGIAASEMAFVLVGLMALAAMSAPPSSPIWLFAGAAALAAITFLIFNWQRARIFGGDAGAYFHAAAIFWVSLAAVMSGCVNPYATVLLPAAFLTDAGVTLGTRALRGKRVWEGHRSHAYQHLARKIGHARTVAVYLVYNLVWLLPLAALIQLDILPSLPGLVLAYFPAIVFVVRNKAGQSEYA